MSTSSGLQMRRAFITAPTSSKITYEFSILRSVHSTIWSKTESLRVPFRSDSSSSNAQGTKLEVQESQSFADPRSPWISRSVVSLRFSYFRVPGACMKGLMGTASLPKATSQGWGGRRRRRAMRGPAMITPVSKASRRSSNQSQVCEDRLLQVVKE